MYMVAAARLSLDPQHFIDLQSWETKSIQLDYTTDLHFTTSHTVTMIPRPGYAYMRYTEREREKLV